MPQLIAMVIVVVGAMIYMFQTFGGTGDKIEGVAQKTSLMTEINNIRGDLIVALKAKELTTASTLNSLATLGYFSKQINEQLVSNTAAVTTYSATNNNTGQINTYSAISFGGKNNPGMNISLIANAAGQIPGIRVQLLGGLAKNATFLEGQITADLAAQATIDRTTVNGAAVAIAKGQVPAANRPATIVDSDGTAGTVAVDAGTLGDGVFTVYFKDLDTTKAP